MLSAKAISRLRRRTSLSVHRTSSPLLMRCAATQVHSAGSKRAGDISDAFVSLSGVLKDAEPLEDRYRILKEYLLAGEKRGSDRDAILRKWNSSWCSLLERIREKITTIQNDSNSYIPTIDFDDVKTSAYKWHKLENTQLLDETVVRLQKFMKDYRERGVAVIRNLVPRSEILELKESLCEYISRNNSAVKGFPEGRNKQVYEIYWSKAQVVARAHPRMLLAQQFLLSFWHAQRPGSEHDTEVIGGLPTIAALPVTYADRLRMRQPGDSKFALGPHVDGGSVERWEDDGYGRGDEGRGTYASVFSGDWQAHDPWYWPGRIGVESDIYKGIGACSIFRAAQGWLAMSEIGPGEGHLMVNPMLKEALAYWLMRPFFAAVQTADEAGERWLGSSNWKLEENVSSKIHGATPGFGQEINPVLHPHLMLEKSMIHMPHVSPGDFVVWHCDTIHAVDPKHKGQADSSVLYIPVCPWTEENIVFAKRQLKTFLAGAPSPDFGGGSGENGFEGQITLNDLNNIISQPGKWSMGVAEDTKYASEANKGEDLYKQIMSKAGDAGSIDWSKW